MATSSTIQYCDENDLLETYPGLSGFDLKRRLINWQTTGTTNRYKSVSSGKVLQLYLNGKELGADAGSEGAVTSDEDWYYDSASDACFYFDSTTSPVDHVMEAGRDWSTLKTEFIKKASRMVESLLDNRLSREIMKDREGNYPEFIIRATALKTIILLIKAHDPENDVLESFEEEFKEIIDGYKSGLIQLPNAVTQDSSKGVIRTVSVNASTDLFPVELKGNYTWEGYDLIKLKVTTAGTIGNAKYSVWVKNQDGLKQQKVVDEDPITGDFDILSSNLYVRFAGDDDSAAVVLNDEWEIEVHGYDCTNSISQGGSVKLSRRYG